MVRVRNPWLIARI